MLIAGLFDSVANKYVQFIPSPSEALLRRDFKNAVSQQNSIYCVNAYDFQVFQLAEIDESTGACLSTEKKLLFTLKELKDDPQVQ